MFLKSKKFWIGIGIFLVLVLFLYPKEKSILYEVIKVERGDLVQTVDVTGKIKSENNIFLYFEASGIIDRIYVAEGERVRRGDVLAKLNLDNLNMSN
jgi:macrolide-specific efflux system membrane fusion protein